MKRFAFYLLFLISLQSHSQTDTMRIYYESGQLEIYSPRLDGKAHGKTTTRFESGQLSSVSTYENGKRTKSLNYHENGNKSSFYRQTKLQRKSKSWHPNGQIWSESKSKYARSIEREFDSIGVLLLKIIEKKGAFLSCTFLMESNPSDSTFYNDGSCVCAWGDVYWRNGVWIDEKGRDLVANYSYIRIDYYDSGTIQKKTIWNNEMKKYIIQEFDKNGNLTN
jgi:antitoxin component YwqK of YwqJK toxin-antitoxin module